MLHWNRICSKSMSSLWLSTKSRVSLLGLGYLPYYQLLSILENWLSASSLHVNHGNNFKQLQFHTKYQWRLPVGIPDHGDDLRFVFMYRTEFLSGLTSRHHLATVIRQGLTVVFDASRNLLMAIYTSCITSAFMALRMWCWKAACPWLLT